MALVYVVRHGRSVWNLERRWAGSADPPLSPEGVRASEALAIALRDERFDRVATSPLRRALQTASIVCNALGHGPPLPVVELAERDAGEWTGLTAEEIATRWPDESARWRRGEPVEPPGAEPWAGFVARVVEGLRIVAAATEHRALAVAHKGVLRAIEWHVAQAAGDASNLAGLWVDVRPDGLSLVQR